MAFTHSRSAPPLVFSPICVAAALLAASAAHAQTGPAQTPTLKSITVQGSSAPPTADVTGFGDVPLKEIPISATVIDSNAISIAGARRLADLIDFDASVTDSYNSPGYWDYLTIRGFTLDNRFNYRREGLPISAETSIPLDNKERVEILKGTSGIQSGTSAPGGLVNYVVKRPTAVDLRRATVEISGRGSVLGAVDLGGRFGVDSVFGYRLNVAHEDLRPMVDNLQGHRDLAALAMDWRLGRDTLLEAEVEWSRKSQPSQAGYSLLGSTLPAVPNPRLNLNNQPWSQPSVFDAFTGTVRLEQGINSNWRWSAQLGQQRLKTDDRLAYPFGCGAEGNFDRFCSDGTYDLYDFRSENESRVQQAANLKLKGKFETAGIGHDLQVGVLASRVRNRFDMQAYNYVGTGNVQGTLFTAPDPTLSDQSTNRDEHSLELSLQDTIRWTTQLSTWVGVRHTRLDRDSVRTDGSRPTGYDASVTTPWVALGYQFDQGPLAYASWGEGVESQIVPNKSSQYSNAGVALPVLKSRQWELGLKGGDDRLGWQLAWFRIERPITNLDACDRLGTTPCEGMYDGSAVHQGLEAGAHWAAGPWRLDGSMTLLDAKRRGSVAEPSTNGQRPINVPKMVARAKATYLVPMVPGLAIDALVSHEGNRAVLPDQSIMLPSWTRFDAAVRYTTKMQGVTTRWIAGVDNIADRRYWRESPTQFGHVYLFAGAPRTFRLALQADF